jgi:hypothetical protein
MVVLEWLHLVAVVTQYQLIAKNNHNYLGFDLLCIDERVVVTLHESDHNLVLYKQLFLPEPKFHLAVCMVDNLFVFLETLLIFILYSSLILKIHYCLNQNDQN